MLASAPSKSAMSTATAPPPKKATSPKPKPPPPYSAAYRSVRKKAISATPSAPAVHWNRGFPSKWWTAAGLHPLLISTTLTLYAATWITSAGKGGKFTPIMWSTTTLLLVAWILRWCLSAGRNKPISLLKTMPVWKPFMDGFQTGIVVLCKIISQGMVCIENFLLFTL